MNVSTLSELSNNLELGCHNSSSGLDVNVESEYDATSSSLDEVQSASNSFLIIGDSMLENNSHEVDMHSAAIQGLGREMRISGKLFDILSEKSIVDHPLCEECADSLIDKMDQKLKNLEEECKDYRECLDKLEKKMKNTDPESNIKKLQDRIKELEKEERR